MRALLLALIPIATPCLAADVVVYRCTDAAGTVALQDTPCSASAMQQRRTLSEPPAATATPAPPAATRADAAGAPPASNAAPGARSTARSPAPLFLCESHDGTTYESSTGIPQRRWVPLWALGADPRAPATALDPDTVGRTSPLRRTARDGPPALTASAQTLGTWVEDVCVPLSPAQVCARRREALAGYGRRIFNAGQSEGDRLRGEERALRAQVVAECE